MLPKIIDQLFLVFLLIRKEEENLPQQVNQVSKEIHQVYLYIDKFREEPK